jgi:hypothetical protein
MQLVQKMSDPLAARQFVIRHLAENTEQQSMANELPL